MGHIINEQGSDRQFDWFVPDKAEGLTQAGLSRINQSIEAFVYCVLGAQVNVRNSILGDGGRAKEAQTEFLVLLGEAIRQPNLSKSVQRYQLAVEEAKVRLNLAVAPGTWLMPARMVINTGSVAGYKNQLRQATPNMKLGVNNSVNLETKKVGARLMDGVLQRSISRLLIPQIQFIKIKKLFSPHKPNYRKPKMREIMKFLKRVYSLEQRFLRSSFINYSDLIILLNQRFFF